MTGPKRGTEDFTVLSPGRVNLLGEHVDYNGGPVLPAAIDLRVRLTVAPRSDRLVELEAQDLGAVATFSLDNLPERLDRENNPLPAWAIYPAGVAWSLQNAGLPLCGMTARFSSTVPIGSGLSSSAAVEVGFAAAWDRLAGGRLSRKDLALLCQQAENEYVGVRCGIMDQYACANGKAGHALLLDTRTVDHRLLPLPSGVVILIADSGQRRSLHHSGYNERRSGCEQAVAILSPFLPGIRSLRDVSPGTFRELQQHLPEPSRSYAQHVVEECDRVWRAASLLGSGDVAGFGALMQECHRSLRDLYHVSTPELDQLVEIANHIPGCYGARLTGAGFGGCTVNLFTADSASSAAEKIKAGYRAATGREAVIYQCKASEGVEVLA